MIAISSFVTIGVKRAALDIGMNFYKDEGGGCFNSFSGKAPYMAHSKRSHRNC